MMESKLEAQITFETLYNKNQLIPRLREEMGSPEVIKYCKERDLPVKFSVDLLVQMCLHKRAKMATLVGLLHRTLMTQKDEIPTRKLLQRTCDLVWKAAGEDLIDYDETQDNFVFRIDVTDDVYEDLNRYQYPLPFLVPPKEVMTNRDTGYYSPDSEFGSIILKNNHHDEDVCLDHINRVNKTKLTLNVDTVRLTQNKWKNIDRKKDTELYQEFHERRRAFDKYNKSSRDVIDHVIMMGNEFYMSHKYDKRGRCYCMGYHVQYQGTDYNKAVVEFKEQEMISDD